jgi:hypothetical protein
VECERFLYLIDELSGEPQQVEVIGELHPAVEFLFGHDFPERPLPLAVIERMLISRLSDGVELISVPLADKDVVGRIPQHFLVATKMGVYFREHLVVEMDVTGGLRSVRTKSGTARAHSSHVV